MWLSCDISEDSTGGKAVGLDLSFAFFIPAIIIHYQQCFLVHAEILTEMPRHLFIGSPTGLFMQEEILRGSHHIANIAVKQTCSKPKAFSCFCINY